MFLERFLYKEVGFQVFGKTDLKFLKADTLRILQILLVYYGSTPKFVKLSIERKVL